LDGRDRAWNTVEPGQFTGEDGFHRGGCRRDTDAAASAASAGMMLLVGLVPLTVAFRTALRTCSPDPGQRSG
jgi:hypothetical protein